MIGFTFKSYSVQYQLMATLDIIFYTCKVRPEVFFFHPKSSNYVNSTDLSICSAG